MRLCVFEDSAVLNLEPLTLTRPAFDLWAGASSLLQRQCRTLGLGDVGLLVRPHLATLCARQHAGMTVNDRAFISAGPLLMVNARWLPPATITIDLSAAHVGLIDKQVAYVMLPDGAATLVPEGLE